MSRCIANEYLVTNSKLGTNNTQMAFISDIHSDANKFATIIERLHALQIHTLLIGGDLIDSTEDAKRNIVIRELLHDLSKTTKIFIAIGNHEIIHFGKTTLNRRYEIKSLDLAFFESLANDNIRVSGIPDQKATFNRWSWDDNIDISSLNLPIEYYWNKENSDDFIALLEGAEKPDINTHKFNILLCHSPKSIFTLGIDAFNQFDLILTGHMHSGLIPYFLRKQTYGRGLVGPYASLLPRYAYGYLSKDNTLLTSGGVTKISSSAELGNHRIFDMLYPSELEILNLQHGTNNSFEKVKTKSIFH